MLSSRHRFAHQKILMFATICANNRWSTDSVQSQILMGKPVSLPRGPNTWPARLIMATAGSPFAVVRLPLREHGLGGPWDIVPIRQRSNPCRRCNPLRIRAWCHPFGSQDKSSGDHRHRMTTSTILATRLELNNHIHDKSRVIRGS